MPYPLCPSFTHPGQDLDDCGGPNSLGLSPGTSVRFSFNQVPMRRTVTNFQVQRTMYSAAMTRESSEQRNGEGLLGGHGKLSPRQKEGREDGKEELYRIGISADLHTPQLEPVPVGIQLCGPVCKGCVSPTSRHREPLPWRTHT